MNGALSDMPYGALMAGFEDRGIDPMTMGLLQTGLGLMRAGGPSPFPVSMGQAFGQAGQQGLQSYNLARQADIENQAQQQRLGMQDLMMKIRLGEMARKQQQPIVGTPGSQFFRPGEDQPYYSVPFKDPAEKGAAAPKPPVAPPGYRFTADGSALEAIPGGPKDKAANPPPPPKPAPAPKAPPGFRFTADGQSLEAIPGGPKDQAPKQAARLVAAQDRAKLVIGKVDEAVANLGKLTTGGAGAVLSRVPGTGAYDLNKTIDTIKANIGFSELQAMREASPTGGALGQIAVQELTMLQAVLSSLDQGQSKEKLRKSLMDVKKHYSNWLKVMERADKGGGDYPAAPQEAINRLKMSPKERDQFEEIFGPGSADAALK